MGLFNFFKNKGNKAFSDDKQAGQKIQETILANNPGVKGLQVSFKNSTAYLSGDVQSAEAMQKAVLMAGNIHGVENVNIDGMKMPAHLPTPQSLETYENTQYYLIQSGDTLSKIAERFYGDSTKYSMIFEANREVIGKPDLIFPGQKIRIPRDRLAKIAS